MRTMAGLLVSAICLAVRVVRAAGGGGGGYGGGGTEGGGGGGGSSASEAGAVFTAGENPDADGKIVLTW